MASVERTYDMKLRDMEDKYQTEVWETNLWVKSLHDMIKTLSTCSDEGDMGAEASIVSENYNSPNFYETNRLKK